MTPRNGERKGAARHGNPVFLRMSDEFEVRRRRALWRAEHRGTKELDLLVGRYAAARLAEMSAGDLDRFERFLAATEPDIQHWLLGPEGAASGSAFADVVADIRRFHGLA